MATQNTPLLNLFGLQKMQQGAEGETGQRFYNRDSFKNLAANLAMGLNSMRLNPDASLPQRMQAQIAQRQQNRTRNRTVEALRKKAEGGDKLAAKYLGAIESGALPVAQAMSAYMQEGAQIARDTAAAERAAAKPSALQEKINAAIEAGFPKGSPEYNKIVLGLDTPQNGMRFGMPLNMYEGLSPDAKKAVDLLGLRGVNFDSEGFESSFVNLVGSQQEGWKILSPNSDQYKLAMQQAFPDGGAEAAKGFVLMGKGDDLKVVRLGSGSTNVSVNIGDKNLEKLIDKATKDGLEVILDENGLPKRNEKGEIMTRKVQGMGAAKDAEEDAAEDLAQSKRDFRAAQTKQIEMNTVNKTINQIFDIMAPKNSDGVRVPKSDKPWWERVITLDPPEAGVLGEASAGLGVFASQEAKDISILLKPIKAVIGFSRLQRMRDESKSGGALGNVSNIELSLLTQSLEAIEQGLSPELLYENLQNVQNIYTKILNDPVANSLLSASSPEEFVRLLGLLDDSGQAPSESGSQGGTPSLDERIAAATKLDELAELSMRKDLNDNQRDALYKKLIGMRK